MPERLFGSRREFSDDGVFIMAIKSIIGVLPGIVAGLGAGVADARTTLTGENVQAELDHRIAVVREHFRATDRVEVRNAGTTLAWYNWNNSFDNWDNGEGPQR